MSHHKAADLVHLQEGGCAEAHTMPASTKRCPGHAKKWMVQLLKDCQRPGKGCQCIGVELY